MIKKLKKSKHSKLPYIIGIIAVLVVAGSLYAYHLTNKETPAPTQNQYTKGQPSQSSSSSSSTSQGQTQTPPNPSKTGGSTGTLIAPTGNFVSDHHPNLSGSPAPNTMTSVCNTTPGASCQISFTNGGITKSLVTHVTDSGGTTYWYWKLQDIGLTSGNWTVTATSSLNGNSLSSTDPMTLVVAQ